MTAGVLSIRARGAGKVRRECEARLSALVAEGTLKAYSMEPATVTYLDGTSERVERATVGGLVDHGLAWLDDFAPADFVPALDYSDLPECVREWLDGLAHEPKRRWAADYCRAVLTGAPEPEVTPGHYTEKAKRRADRLFFSGEGDMTGTLNDMGGK